MSDAPTYLPGTLTLFTDSNVKQMRISLDIPPQTIRLIGYRIEMASQADAEANPVLYLDLPRIFNYSKMLDGNPGYTYLPVFLDHAKVTLQTSTNVPISMAHHLPDTFIMRILDSTFAPVSDLVNASFQFELFYGHS